MICPISRFVYTICFHLFLFYFNKYQVASVEFCPYNILFHFLSVYLKVIIFLFTSRNENSPCGNGGRAICKQMTRAHWSLVWTPGRGVNLVAHEVPSHCECLNVGGPDVPLRTSSFTASKVPLPANAFGNLDTPPLTNAFAASSSSNSLSGNVGFVHDDKNYNNRDADSDSVVNLDVNPFTGSSQFTDVSLFKSPATFESFPAHP